MDVTQFLHLAKLASLGAVLADKTRKCWPLVDNGTRDLNNMLITQYGPDAQRADSVIRCELSMVQCATPTYQLRVDAKMALGGSMVYWISINDAGQWEIDIS